MLESRYQMPKKKKMYIIGYTFFIWVCSNTRCNKRNKRTNSIVFAQIRFVLSPISRSHLDRNR